VGARSMICSGPLVLSSVDCRDVGKAVVLRPVAAVTCRLSCLSASNYRAIAGAAPDVSSDPFSRALVYAEHASLVGPAH
jgi:hypothetical protein